MPQKEQLHQAVLAAVEKKSGPAKKNQLKKPYSAKWNGKNWHVATDGRQIFLHESDDPAYDPFFLDLEDSVQTFLDSTEERGRVSAADLHAALDKAKKHRSSFGAGGPHVYLISSDEKIDPFGLANPDARSLEVALRGAGDEPVSVRLPATPKTERAPVVLMGDGWFFLSLSTPRSDLDLNAPAVLIEP